MAKLFLLAAFLKRKEMALCSEVKHLCRPSVPVISGNWLNNLPIICESHCIGVLKLNENSVKIELYKLFSVYTTAKVEFMWREINERCHRNLKTAAYASNSQIYFCSAICIKNNFLHNKDSEIKTTTKNDPLLEYELWKIKD